jgi:membrane associated rhomboid family serine protease
MNGFFDDFKNAWNKPHNAVAQIIIINVIIFAVHALIRLFFSPAVFNAIYFHFAIPSELELFILRPWTIITYAFTHSMATFWHILMNMLVFYWFGKLVEEYLGSNKVIGIYILGAIFAGVVYLLAYNFLPFYSDFSRAVLVGASGSVYAVMVAAATLMPDYRFFLLFLGPVRIKYIAAVLIFISFISTADYNAGGNLAHLGGAFLGYIFVVQLRKGSDWSKPVIVVMAFFKGLFKKNPKIRVSHKKPVENTPPPKRNPGDEKPQPQPRPDQKEIDAILDKISEKGYESLTKEEKEKLFNASRK